MAIKIFLLGRPGTGKSTAARTIQASVHDSDWQTAHINDYHFLMEMFKADSVQQRFRPTGCGGFDVLDFSVLDEALKQVEREAELYKRQGRTLLLLEFARNDYVSALEQFNAQFLQDAHFLCFETDIDTCVRRVYQRSSHPTFSDDHFISEEMIRSYYGEEHCFEPVIQRLIAKHIPQPNIHIVHNGQSKTLFEHRVCSIMNCIMEQQYQVCGPTRKFSDAPKKAVSYAASPRGNRASHHIHAYCPVGNHAD